jgi:hypothetical protein
VNTEDFFRWGKTQPNFPVAILTYWINLYTKMQELNPDNWKL